MLESLAPLRVDMHSHLLPGIDDGAQTMEDSMALIKRMVDLGYTELWTTPHVMADLYPNSTKTILAKLEDVRIALRANGIRIPINAAAEYLLDEGFGTKIKEDDLLTLPGKRVLVEMSFVSPTPLLDDYVFQLQTKGYRVVLAHPERYLYYRNQPDQYERLHARGVEFQINLLSLSGHYGTPTYENALFLLENGMVDYFGTDLHHSTHAEKLAALTEDKRSSRLLAKHIKLGKNPALAA